MRKFKMKKDTLVKGAFITSLGIIITKILGVVYVVPFHAIIGETGGALYSYAYTVYLLFISLFTAGIPLAISKLVSEYRTLGYSNVKNRVFTIGKFFSLIVGVISFLLIVVLAPVFTKLIFGNLIGSSSFDDVVLAIRVIGISCLIGPLLSTYRGYFEGHSFMVPPSVSQVIEQLFRIIFIIFASLIALKVFKSGTTSVVCVALVGASIGSLISLLYLYYVYKNNTRKFNDIKRVNEPIITSKVIIKKIILYSIPFVMIDIFKSLYNYVDMFSVIKGLVKYANYDVFSAEAIYSMMSTWAQKFNLIIYSISTGIVISLIPNITESFTNKKYDEVNSKIMKSLNILAFVVIPMSFGICVLAKPIWILFYGNSTYGPSVLGYYIFVGLFGSLFTTLLNILLVLKEYRSVLISLISGFLVKLIFNTTFLRTFIYFDLPPYYGFITATIMGFLVSIVICFIVLSVRHKVNFERFTKNLFDIICNSLIMVVVLLLMRLIVPSFSDSRIVNLFIIFIYTLVGFCSYLGYSYFTGTLREFLGDIKKRIGSLFKY